MYRGDSSSTSDTSYSSGTGNNESTPTDNKSSRGKKRTRDMAEGSSGIGNDSSSSKRVKVEHQVSPAESQESLDIKVEDKVSPAESEDEESSQMKVEDELSPAQNEDEESSERIFSDAESSSGENAQPLSTQPVENTSSGENTQPLSTQPVENTNSAGTNEASLTVEEKYDKSIQEGLDALQKGLDALKEEYLRQGRYTQDDYSTRTTIGNAYRAYTEAYNSAKERTKQAHHGTQE